MILLAVGGICVFHLSYRDVESASNDEWQRDLEQIPDAKPIDKNMKMDHMNMDHMDMKHGG